MSAALLHGTGVSINGNGIILLGPSAAGKSDLALRLIDRGAFLISDDVVPIIIGPSGPELHSAPNIEGRLEVRGIGIVPVAHVESSPLRLAVELADPVDRLPDDGQCTDIAGFAVPFVKILPFEASAALKVEYALRMVVDAGTQPMASHADLIQESRTD
jgi:serine kinase of HPr protein (carbohydrate metabolism regulator)